MNYYQNQFKKGKEYEKFIVDKFKEYGITLTLTKDFNEQINIGETYEGYEIKFDDKYKETSNLWIETQERTKIDNKYVESGILRNDNTIYYVIGDYECVFIFSKDKLKELKKTHDIRENNMKTSKGYLLTVIEALENCERYIDLKQKELMDWY